MPAQSKISNETKDGLDTHPRDLPDFLYVGASKCASSFIYEVLREHPDVFVPDAKDIMFFNRHYDNKSLAWYRTFFRNSGNFSVRGELSHDYFLDPMIAERIARHLPNIKILACLREPIDRTQSRWIYMRSIGLPSAVDFDEFSRDENILRENDYLHNLKPYYRLLSAENILVLFYEDLLRDPAEFVRMLYKFLKVDDSFRAPSLHKKVLSARQTRNPFVGKFTYRVAQMLRDLGGANLVGAVKRSVLFETLLYQPIIQKPQISPITAARIHARFAGDWVQLETMIGKAVPSEWKVENRP